MSNETKSTKKNEKIETKGAEAAAGAFADLLPSIDENFREVGLLTPMYKPKLAWEKKLPPILGLLTHCVALPKQNAGTDNEWVPLSANVILLKPNVGFKGKKGQEEAVDVPVGESLLVPLTGNLLYRQAFMMALSDPQFVWVAQITLTGQQPSDYPSDMWTWKPALNGQKVPRKDPRFALFDTIISPAVYAELDEKIKKALPATMIPRVMPVGGQLPNGEIYTKDGEIVDAKRMMGQAQA